MLFIIHTIYFFSKIWPSVWNNSMLAVENSQYSGLRRVSRSFEPWRSVNSMHSFEKKYSNFMKDSGASGRQFEDLIFPSKNRCFASHFVCVVIQPKFPFCSFSLRNNFSIQTGAEVFSRGQLLIILIFASIICIIQCN